MVEDVEMEVTPLVKALTRTPTLFGVPYMYSMFNMVVTAVVFLLTKNLLSGFLVFPIHALGYVLTLRDDKIFKAAMWATRHGVCAPRSRPALAAVYGKTVAPGISLAEDHGGKTESQVNGAPDHPDEIRVERSPGAQLRIQLSERRMMEEQERREELLANARRLRELREARETEMRRSRAD